MGKNSALGVLSFSVANRRRDFLLPSVAASASLVWQRPASWFNSTPRFLAAQRSAVSSLGEEVAQREPLKGFPLDSFGNKRAAALLRSREFRICSVRQVEHLLRILEALSFWYARLYWFVKWPTIFLPSSKFVTLCPPQGIFALQKFLRAGCDGGRVTSSQREKSPRKEISRGNLLCAESGLPSLSYPRLQSVQKYVGTLDWYNQPYRAAPGCQRGRAPLFRKESRGNPSQGFPWGNFFAAARHRASLRS